MKQNDITWKNKARKVLLPLIKNINAKNGTENCGHIALRVDTYLATGKSLGLRPVSTDFAKLYFDFDEMELEQPIASDKDQPSIDRIRRVSTRDRRLIKRAFCHAIKGELLPTSTLIERTKDTTNELEFIELINLVEEEQTSSRQEILSTKLVHADEENLIAHLQTLPRRSSDGTARGFLLFVYDDNSLVSHISNFLVDADDRVYFIDAQLPRQEERVLPVVPRLGYRKEIFFLQTKAYGEDYDDRQKIKKELEFNNDDENIAIHQNKQAIKKEINQDDMQIAIDLAIEVPVVPILHATSAVEVKPPYTWPQITRWIKNPTAYSNTIESIILGGRSIYNNYRSNTSSVAACASAASAAAITFPQDELQIMAVTGYLQMCLQENAAQINEGHDMLMLAMQEQSIEAYFYLGHCYMEGIGITKNPELAFQYFHKVVEIEPGHVLALANLANCYINGIGTTRRDFTKGLQYNQKAISADVNNTVYEESFRQCFLAHSSAAPITTAAAPRPLPIDFSNKHIIKLGRVTGTSTLFSNSLDTLNDFANSENKIQISQALPMELVGQKRKHTESVADTMYSTDNIRICELEHQRESKPNDVRILMELGKAYLQSRVLTHKRSIAVEVFGLVIRNDPTNAEAWINKANCYLHLHYYKKNRDGRSSKEQDVLYAIDSAIATLRLNPWGSEQVTSVLQALQEASNTHPFIKAREDEIKKRIHEAVSKSISNNRDSIDVTIANIANNSASAVAIPATNAACRLYTRRDLILLLEKADMQTIELIREQAAAYNFGRIGKLMYGEFVLTLEQKNLIWADATLRMLMQNPDLATDSYNCIYISLAHLAVYYGYIPAWHSLSYYYRRGIGYSKQLSQEMRGSKIVDIAQKIAQIDPNDVPNLLKLAEVCFQATGSIPQNKDAAASLIKQALHLSSSDVDRSIFYELLYIVYMNQKLYKEADEALLKAIEYDQHCAYLWRILAKLFIKLDDAEKAILAWGKALELNPKIQKLYPELNENVRRIAAAAKNLNNTEAANNTTAIPQINTIKIKL